jgi:hypothetical protein
MSSRATDGRGWVPTGEMTREELATMTDQELVADDREHHDDPDLTLAKATETQRLALQFWASGAANKKEDQRRRDVAFIRSCFRPTPLSLSQKGWTRLEKRHDDGSSPDPLTKLAATRDTTAQMRFPRLLPDRTREIAEGIGSAPPGPTAIP